ncbi:copper amine oxidase N-terminal domain-containing protein [Paenibacillus campi]|uniref:copper amine oxidase N-terminal domain-containing protein n=1 Tax=Paenibacillus campi TaxID=3106031 RepID=UPI002AFE021C|nr:copper amine oxidase N-terminal domain-containing protein [Paenibacillus sp. SGZ-1009]
MMKTCSKLFLLILLVIGCVGETTQATAAKTVAKSTPDIQVIVNNSTVYVGVTAYVEQGTTMIPIKALQYIPGNSTIWNNITQTVTVSQDGNVITLIIGQKTATINDRTVQLPVAPEIREGRAMVPLRFVAEAAQATVVWNPTARTVYVAKTPETALRQLSSPDLATARAAAVGIPRINKLKIFTPSDNASSGIYSYYFPQGQSFPFFEQRGDVVSYYEMKDNHSELVWTAKLNLNEPSRNNLFFLPYAIEQEDGTMPTILSNVAFYNTLTPNGVVRYGYIENPIQSSNVSNREEFPFPNISGEQPAK